MFVMHNVGLEKKTMTAKNGPVRHFVNAITREPLKKKRGS